MAVKNYSDIDFSIRFKKRWIQTFFYRSSKVKNSNVLILCGPDIVSHYNDFKLITPCQAKCTRLIIAELDIKTYLQNITDLAKITNTEYVVINDDIANVPAERFVDLDFCKNLSSTINTVDIVYKKMLKIKRNGTNTKHLLITFSIDRKGEFSLKSNIESLCILFSINNDFIKFDKLPHSNIMEHKTVNCMYSTYRDGTPMCTFSYQW